MIAKSRISSGGVAGPPLQKSRNEDKPPVRHAIPFAVDQPLDSTAAWSLCKATCIEFTALISRSWPKLA